MASPFFQFVPLKENYLFMAVLVLHCCLVFSLLVAVGDFQLRWAGSPAGSGFSYCRARLQGMQALAAAVLRLQSTSSVAVVHGFSYSTTVGVSQARDPSRLLHWQVTLPLSHRKPFHFVKWYQSAQRRSAVYLIPWWWSETGLCVHTVSSATEWLNLDCFWFYDWTPE